MKLSRCVFAGVLLSLLCLPSWAQAQTAPGRTSFGIRFGDQLAEGYLDLILPLAGGDADLLFVNPRFGLGDEGASELNIGFGYRRVLGGSRVVGGNVYFDSRRTQFDNRFSQVGFGLEYLSTWIDVRGNYYLPIDEKQLADVEVQEGIEVTVTEKTSRLYGPWSDPYAVENEIRQDVDVRVDTALETTTTTTKKTFEDWESAREGFDAELGVRVPLFGADEAQATPALRLFGGYYYYEDDFGARLEGPKGRLELRALPYLTFDVEVYQDKELYGSGAIAGARLHTPFDIAALLQGRNPFPAPAREAGAAARLNEMVMRDVRVQTETSGLAENESLRQLTVETQVERTKTYVREQYVLLDDVVFVDGENASGPGQNGTAENPYGQIQQGANNVYGLKNLYVYAAPGNYVENVVLQEGTTMIGQGTGIVGMEGKVFGGDAYPVITTYTEYSEPVPAGPDPVAPAVTLANNTTVTGFTIEHGIAGIYGMDVSGAISIVNNNVTGPGLANIVVGTSGDASVTIADNFTDGGLIGIGLLNLGGRLSAQVNDNVVVDTLIGIGVANLEDEGVVSFDEADLQLLAPLTDLAPAAVDADDAAADAGPATTDLTATGNLVLGSFVGVGVANVGAGAMNATLSGNGVHETGIGMIGLNVGPSIVGLLLGGETIAPGGTLSLTATNNLVTNTSGGGLLGIGVVNAGEGTTLATIGGSGAGNVVDGFALGIGVGNVSVTVIADNSQFAEPLPAPPPTLSASIVGNTVTGAELVGIGAGALGNAGTVVLIDGNSVEAGGYGVGIGAVGEMIPFDTLGLDPLAAPVDGGAALDVTISNNRIVSEHSAGLAIFGLGSADMQVRLRGNIITGLGPGILVSAHNDSSVDFRLRENNSITSLTDNGIVFESFDDSVVEGFVAGSSIDAAQAEIRGRLIDTGMIVLNAYDNTGADTDFLISLEWETTSGAFLYNVGGNENSVGGAATVAELGPGW